MSARPKWLAVPPPKEQWNWLMRGEQAVSPEEASEKSKRVPGLRDLVAGTPIEAGQMVTIGSEGRVRPIDPEPCKGGERAIDLPVGATALCPECGKLKEITAAGVFPYHFPRKRRERDGRPR